MSNFHIATDLHASCVNALEASLHLSLKVISPAIATESMTAAQSFLIAFLKQLIADVTVALILTHETRLHFWVLLS